MSYYQPPGPAGGPYQPPSSGGPSSSSPVRLIAAAVVGVAVLATIVSFVVSRGKLSSNAQGVGANGSFSVPAYPSGGKGVGVSKAPTGTGNGPGVSSAPSTPSSSPSTDDPSSDDPSTPDPSPSDTPQPTSTYVPMNGTQVGAVLKLYFNGFLNHNLTDVLTATCPEKRPNYTGTFINGNEISSWQSPATDLPSYGDVALIPVTATLRDPNSGASAGTYNHTWHIVRRNSLYYVCGYNV